MSDLSLLTGIYANVEQFAALVDTVIRETRRNTVLGEAQRRLGQLLVDTGDHGQSSRSYEALILDSFLRDPGGDAPVDLPQLGSKLLTGQLSETDRQRLELIAQSLERQRTDVAGRLWGRG